VLRWVHDEDLPALHAELIEAGLAEDGALTLTDVMTCPGADTCSLGVTSSKGLGTAIRDELIAKNGHFKSDPLVEQVRIKISGRLGGADMSRKDQERQGRVPLHTLKADVDYGTSEAATTLGRIGVKVWIYKGDIIL